MVEKLNICQKSIYFPVLLLYITYQNNMELIKNFHLPIISTAKNTVISLDFLLWKCCGKAQFLQNFHTRKLDEIIAFFAVLFSYVSRFTKEPFTCETLNLIFWQCSEYVFKLIDWLQKWFGSISILYPAGNHMFNVNNKNTRTKCEICSKLKMNTPKRRLASFWCLYC